MGAGGFAREFFGTTRKNGDADESLSPGSAAATASPAAAADTAGVGGRPGVQSCRQANRIFRGSIFKGFLTVFI